MSPEASARGRRSGAHRIALLAAATMTIVACADVIGASNHLDAVEELCRFCDTAGSLPDCKKKLTSGLATAKDSDIADWLQTYVDLDCGRADCTTTALECFYTAPGVCTELGQTCTRSQECCKFDFDDARKGSGCCGPEKKGHCCEECLTCAKAVGVLKPDMNAVCLSHQDSVAAVVSCRNTTCMSDCADTKLSCDQCVATKCPKIAQACNDNQAP